MTIKELPAINWIELNKTGDLRLLSKTGKICSKASIVFEKIRDQIIDEFGASEDFLRIHKANINLELLQCEMLQTGDKSLMFHIEMEEKTISDLLKPLINNSKNDFYDAMVWIKKQQISFDENKVSTFWFLKYMDNLMRQIKQSKIKDNVRK